MVTDMDDRIGELTEISPPPFDLPDVCTGSVCYRRLVTTMVMSAKTEFWIAVIGLSGRENGESFQGPGKSCLCDRFMYPDKEPSYGHTSIVSQQDFHGPIINTDHFLYWGRTRRTVDGKVVEFNIIEQTEFLDDVTFSPFNARDPYIKRATAATINSSRKIQYLSPEHLQDPKSQKAQKFASRKLHIDGFLCVYDVSKINDREAGTQYKFVFELLDLIDVPVVLVATKCDKGRSRHFEEMMYLAKVQKVPIVETSALENVNVAQAFFSLVRIFNRQVIVSKKHIQYFNPKELTKSRRNKKVKKVEKKADKKNKKNMKSKIEEKPIRNGSLTSRNDSDMSGCDIMTVVPTTASHNPGPLAARDSPLTDSLLSDPACEPPYEHINGDSPDFVTSSSPYENCTRDFSPRVNNDSAKGSRCESAGSTQGGHSSHDTQSRDSQLSKSDSLQSKTSSDEYIPVPRAPYDPSDNYENVRYHHRPPSSSCLTACPSPTSHSSDSERSGFLTGIPDHMKSVQLQRPWETSYYTNITIETPASNQSDPGTSSAGTRSTSSIDTDCQANIHYGRQLAVRTKPAPGGHQPASYGPMVEGQAGSVVSSTGPPDVPTDPAPLPAYANVIISQDGQLLFPENDTNGLADHEEGTEEGSSTQENDLPPYPDICFSSCDGVLTGELNRDLEEMNSLVGEISNLVWQNEPLPPPPPPSDFLTPATIPDFEKTPTNELASPSPYLNPTENGFDYPINDVELKYENVQLPELPPRQPVLPPRSDTVSSRNSSVSSRDVTTSSRDHVTSSRDLLSPSKPDLPQRIPLAGRDKLAPFVPPREKALTLPPRSVPLPSRDVTLPRDLSLPPRTIPLPPRDSLTLPRNASSTAGPSRDNQTLPPPPPRLQPRAAPPPQRIPHRVVENGAPPPSGPPNLPPRVIKPDQARHDPSTSTLHMPARVPLPPGRPTSGPLYTEVEKKADSAFPRVIHQHEFSPYVVPRGPRIDRWDEYTNDCFDKKSQTLKKKVKVKIPQR